MSTSELLLGVNIDHVATLRRARGTRYPDPIQAAIEAEQAGADAITLHLREDRSHIQDRDVELLAEILQTRMNLVMAITEEMLTIAEQIQPVDCCLVPERREELTTEGGLEVAGQFGLIRDTCARLKAAGIRVSLFVDADPKQIEASGRAGADAIEIHTGHFANNPNREGRDQELRRIIAGAEQASAAGLQVHAGHGLNYHNVTVIARIPEVSELNIGHAIIARSVFTGLAGALWEMKRLMQEARR